MTVPVPGGPETAADLRASVLALHTPRQNAPGLPPACPDCLGGIHADDPDEARPCGCWGLSTPVCAVCSDPDAVTSRRYPLQWPCPTARVALAAAPGGAEPATDGEVERLRREVAVLRYNHADGCSQAMYRAEDDAAELAELRAAANAAPEPVECCAPGRCEVCSPGFRW